MLYRYSIYQLTIVIKRTSIKEAIFFLLKLLYFTLSCVWILSKIYMPNDKVNSPKYRRQKICHSIKKNKSSSSGNTPLLQGNTPQNWNNKDVTSFSQWWKANSKFCYPPNFPPSPNEDLDIWHTKNAQHFKNIHFYYFFNPCLRTWPTDCVFHTIVT